MEKLNKFELRNIIQTLHKREDLTIVERLAKFIEKMNDELASMRQEVESYKGGKDNSKETESLRREVSAIKQRLERLERIERSKL